MPQSIRGKPGQGYFKTACPGHKSGSLINSGIPIPFLCKSQLLSEQKSMLPAPWVVVVRGFSKSFPDKLVKLQRPEGSPDEKRTNDWKNR